MTFSPMFQVDPWVPQLIDLSDSVLVVLKKNQDVLFINRKGADLLGWPASEIEGSKWFDRFIPIESRAARLNRFLAMLNGEFEFSTTQSFGEIVNAKNERLLMSWRHAPWKNADGILQGILSSGTNITEFENLRQTHIRLTQVIDSMAVLLIGINDKNQITQWNRAAEATFGIPANEVLGKTFPETSIPWEWDERLRNVPGYPFSGQSLQIPTLQFKHKDGQDGVLNLVVTPLRWVRKKCIEYIIVAMDRTLSTFSDRLSLESQKLEAIGRLSAGIAHEINTPMQYIGDNLRFIQEGTASVLALLLSIQKLTEAGDSAAFRPVLDLLAGVDLNFLVPEIPKAIGQSLEGVSRVTAIVRAMKDFSHPDSGSEKIQVDINAALRTTALVTKNAWKYVAEVVFDLEENLPPVSGYSGELNQVFVNLITNAAEALRETSGPDTQKGLITLATRHTDQAVEIRISDNGAGIPEAIREKIFESFFTTKPKGTGQGLAISRHIIVQDHQGQLDFETEVGRGTTFVVQLPFSASKAPNEETP